MKRYFKIILSTVFGLLLSPATSLALCTSNLASTPNVAPGNSILAGVGGSSTTDVWAVGSSGVDNNPPLEHTLVEHFNGSTWSIIPSPNHGFRDSILRAVTAVSSANAWAVGMSVAGGDIYYELIEHWNGSTWSIKPIFDQGYHYLTAVSSVPSDPASVWAVGGTFVPNCRLPYGCDSPIAVYWSPNDRMWKTTDAVLNTVDARLTAVVSVPGGNAWAVGLQNRISGTLYRALIEHWAGGKWTVVRGAVTGGSLSAIAGLSDTDVWAVGSTNPGNPVNGPLVEHWNGAQWAVVKTPFPFNSYVDSISELSSNDVWIGGGYSPSTSTNAILPLLAHYDGTSWSIVPSPSDGLQSSIAGLFQSSAGAWSVGSALPTLQYSQITFAALSHC